MSGRAGVSDVRAARIQALLLHAFAAGESLQIVCGMKSRPTIGDIAVMERSIGRWLSGSLREWGVKLPRNFFKVDLASLVHKDDGEDTVTIDIDFAALFPGERDPEAVAKARALLDRLEAEDT